MDAKTSLSNYSNYFYIIPWPNGSNNPVATQFMSNNNYIDYYNGNFKAQNWTLTVTAVPEPSTWVLMLLGFGGLGFAAARRNQERVSHAAA